MSEPTICAKCKHFKSIEDGHRTGIWYNLFCMASPNEAKLNVVTGEKELPGGQTHRNCRDVNQGNCEKFEPKFAVRVAEYPRPIKSYHLRFGGSKRVL